MYTKAKLFIDKYIRNNEMFSRFANIFSVDVLVRGANFLLIPIFLYLMTKQEFGIYGYLYSFAMTVSSILNFGFYVAMTKMYADTVEDRKKQASMLFTVTSSLLCLIIISFIVIFFSKIDVDFFSLLNKSNEINSRIYLNYRVYVFVAILSMIFTNFLTFYFVSSEQIKKLQAFNLIRLFLSNGISIVILYYSSADAAMLRLAITYVVELFLTIVFGYFLFKRFECKFDKTYLIKAFRLGLPIMITALMYSVVNFGDKFFVVKYAGVDEFATYNLAIMLATIILIIYQSFNFVWLPLFLKEKCLHALRRKTRRYTIMIFIGFSILGVLIWLGSFVALKIKLFPQNYQSILVLLPILILAQIFDALYHLYINYMTYFEKTYIQTIVGTILSVVGYFMFEYFTSKYFVLGASIVLLLLNIITFVFYYLRTEYYIKNRINHNQEIEN